MLAWIFAALLVLHGLVHLLGAAKAFGIASLPQLTQPISATAGAAWLAAALAMVGAGLAFPWSPRWWWIAGAVALVLSQAVILSAWTDARFGTIPNLLLLAAVAHSFAAAGPLSFRETYRREVRARIVDAPPPSVLSEADIAHLPEAVQRYMRVSGAVGQPRVHHVRAAWKGRIRAKPGDPWMEFTAEQHNFTDEPSRFFLLDARRRRIPVDVLHAYHDGDATMRVRLLSLVPLVEETGPEMRQGETVTVLNDFCVFAPGALIDPRIAWQEIDDRRVRATYTIGSHTVSAVLVFDEAGELVDFVSDDRFAAVEGEGFVAWRWSTPLGEYRAFGPLWLASRGEGIWHAPDGAYAYIELELLEVDLNGAAP